MARKKGAMSHQDSQDDMEKLVSDGEPLTEEETTAIEEAVEAEATPKPATNTSGHAPKLREQD